MKRSTLFFAIIVFMLYPVLGLASYQIELTNAATFLTDQHWEEGNQIKFYYYGGVIGVRRALVREIKDSDLTYGEEEPELEKKETPLKPEKAESKSKKKRNRSAPPPPKENFLIEKDGIMIEITSASNAYNLAKSKRDEKLEKEAWKNVLLLQTKMHELRERAKKAHGGKIPTWWDEDR